MIVLCEFGCRVMRACTNVLAQPGGRAVTPNQEHMRAADVLHAAGDAGDHNDLRCLLLPTRDSMDRPLASVEFDPDMIGIVFLFVSFRVGRWWWWWWRTVFAFGSYGATPSRPRRRYFSA